MRSFIVYLAVLTIAAPGVCLDGYGQTASDSQAAATPITVGETFSIKSQRLNENRRVQVYLPASYAGSKQRYPVIYALDGEATGPVAANAMQFLTGNAAIPQMPEAIVVGVVNTDRNRDMPVPTEYGHGDEANFLAFLSDELIPAIEKRYRTEPLRILLGHSQGGLFGQFAFATRPATFQWYLILDAPLSGFPEVKPIMEKSVGLIKDPRFRGRLVSVETLYGWKQEWPTTGWGKGAYAEQIKIGGETHETMPYKGTYEGLKSLFHDYAPPVEGKAKEIYTLPVLEQKYQTLSQAYGYQVTIPRQLLLLSASENIAVRHGAEATALIDRAVALYGTSPRTKQMSAEAEEAVTMGRDPRLEEWDKLASPDLESMKPFLGKWESIMSDGARLRINFFVENGAFQVQYSLVPPGGDAFTMDVQFVRPIDSQHLEWGIHNGKGTGIIHFSGALVGNALQGTIEPVGIEHAPPPHPATFKRVEGSDLSAQVSFDYLRITGQNVQTTNHLSCLLKIDQAFHFLGETNHQPTFNGKEFNVSLAAFASSDSFLMIHSESHTVGWAQLQSIAAG